MSASSALKRQRVVPGIRKEMTGGGSKVWSEITELARLPTIIADLGQGYPDFPGNAAARATAADVIQNDSRLNQYSLVNGLPALRQSIASFYAHAYPSAGKLDANTQVVITSSGTEALFAAIAALVEEGDEVITVLPSFPWYSPNVRMARGVLKHVTLDFPDFKLTEAKLREQFSPRTKLVVINSPHNPTGHVLSREEAELVAKLCVEHDCFCLSDEVYEQYVFNPTTHQHVRMCDMPGMRDRTLTVGSASKMFSLTGWRVGWLHGPEDLIAASKTVHSFGSYCAPTPLQDGVRAAFDHATKHGLVRSEHNALFQRNAARLAEALATLNVTSSLPEGGYFLVCDVTKTGKTDVEFCHFLAKERGVVAVPMSVFFEGQPVSNLVRFAICKTEQVMDKAVRAILG